MEISKDFKKWLDAYGKNRSARRNLEKRTYLISDDLFDGKSLSDVILTAQRLLESYGDVVYEDMEPCLVWWEPESDEGYNLRISDLHEKYLKEKEKLRKDEERAKLESEMKALQEKINNLK